MSQFSHLHVHSHFSLLNALPKIPELIEAAKKDGMTSLALTDNSNLYGAIEFYQKCLDTDIKPIIGIDAFVALRSRHDKQAGVDKGWNRLVLLAKNRAGYGNIIQLVTDAHLEGFYYKPRIDKELIEKYSDNLVCISPSFSGDISSALRAHDTKKATELIEFYKNVYGPNNFFIEITHHPEIEGHENHMKELLAFARKTETPIVAAHDVYYLKPEDRAARNTLLSVSNSAPRSYDEGEEDFSFISQKQAEKLFKDTPDALENTQKIAEMCNIEIKLGQEAWKFPAYDTPNGKGPDDELRDLAYKGLAWRKMKETDEVRKRIDYELEVIKTKGYSKYFLVVADLLRFAKENMILANTRGSAAGSLVSYLVGITIVDPLDLKLPFERFLNPDRPSAPDIDMDFADSRRDEVIEYARQKYGADHVAQIGTFGTMLARGSVRDTARALGFSYNSGDKIAKLIPMGAQGFPMTINRALDEVPELKALYKKDEEVKTIIDMARKIEGCARHIGVHAAGVVISPDPLTVDVPVQHDPKGSEKLITQYDMHAVGEDGVGLLKFDFLGLKNLTIMGNTIKLIKKVLGEEVDVDEVPLNDQKTYEMLSRGETAATFQLNGSGMTRFLKELKPNNIDDINAMVALYRPGPMAFIPDYIERKHNPHKVKYLDERMKDILEQTFGILMYQDDVMTIAVQFAGYSWGDADKFRKAMGKKIPELMAEQKEKFFKGCKEVGDFDDRKTQALWDQIETFAAYGFNKAHAASYGRVAYLTSYLKANYPVLYMASVLTADQGDVDKVAEMITECKRMGIEVLPPDINESFEDFASVGKEKKIRFGLTTIKNFGEGIAHVIVEERKANGHFASLSDFLSRIKNRNLNKKSLEALIKTGALDAFGELGAMLASVDNLLEYNKDLQKMSEDQTSLFGATTSDKNEQLTLADAEPASMDDKLAWEKELLGLYISGHPLDKFKKKLSKNGNVSVASSIKAPSGATVMCAGLLSSVREIHTKKGDLMAFIQITDYSGSVEAVAFPKTFEEFAEILKQENCVVIKGKLSDRNDEKSILIDKVKLLT